MSFKAAQRGSMVSVSSSSAGASSRLSISITAGLHWPSGCTRCIGMARMMYSYTNGRMSYSFRSGETTATSSDSSAFSVHNLIKKSCWLSMCWSNSSAQRSQGTRTLPLSSKCSVSMVS